MRIRRALTRWRRHLDGPAVKTDGEMDYFYPALENATYVLEYLGSKIRGSKVIRVLKALMTLSGHAKTATSVVRSSDKDSRERSRQD